MTAINKNCTSTKGSDYYYLTYTCYGSFLFNVDSEIEIGNTTMNRQNFAWVIVGIDLVSMFTLLIALIIIPIEQEKNEKYFKENIIRISDYTLKLKKLKLNGLEIYSELNELVKHLNIVKEKEFPGDEGNNIIYDINYPILTDDKLSLIIDRNKVEKKIKQKQTKLTKLSIKDEKRHSVLSLKIEKMTDEDKNLQNKIKHEISAQLSKVDDVYVTFTNQKYPLTFNKIYSKTKCARCCMIMCCQKHKIKHL